MSHQVLSTEAPSIFWKVRLVVMGRAWTTAIIKVEPKSSKSRSTAAAEGATESRRDGFEMELRLYGCSVFSPQGWGPSDSSYLCRRQSSVWKPQVRNHCQRYWQVHQTPQPFQAGVSWIMMCFTGGLVWDPSNYFLKDLMSCRNRHTEIR